MRTLLVIVAATNLGIIAQVAAEYLYATAADALADLAAAADLACLATPHDAAIGGGR